MKASKTIGVACLAASFALASCGGSAKKTAATTTTTTAAKTIVTVAPTTVPLPVTTTAPTTTTTAALPAGYKAESPTGALKKNDAGERVKKLQARLTKLGFAAGPADGLFGAQTDKAVKAYQAAKGLGADGIVGPETSASLDTDCSQGRC